MCIGRRHGGGGGYTLVSRLESEKSRGDRGKMIHGAK